MPGHPSARLRSLRHRLRRDAGAFVADNFFRVISAAGRLHPQARPVRHRVEVLRNIPYLDTRREEHRLDIYRPLTGDEAAGRRPIAAPPWPVVLYVHGGAFRILSKDTHWIMGLAFARRGFLVVNISYRLAPRHPYPAALEDAAAAYAWTVEHARRYGGDPSRLVLAGESAGANLVTALTVTACYRRPEPFANKVFATGVTPTAVLPACGLLQVSDPERFLRRHKLSPLLFDRIAEATDAYLRRAHIPEPGGLDLADPLVVLERGLPPDRPLPPFFVPVGTKDPLLDDTRRLDAALGKLGAECEARYYPGGMHAFHALVFLPEARRCWADTYAFLDRHLGKAVARRRVA